MTARDKIYNAMAGGWSLTQAEAARLYAVIDDCLAAHAHELAEQQRADAQARHDRSYSDNRIFELKGAQNAANLIDPKAQP